MEKQLVTSNEDVLAAIREVLVTFDIEPEKVQLDSSFDLLGLDSLDLVELSVKVEDIYGIDIEEDDLEKVWQVGHAVDLVLQKTAARA